MHKCIGYANNEVFMMIRTWAFIKTGGTDKSVHYETNRQIPILRIADTCRQNYLVSYLSYLSLRSGAHSCQKLCALLLQPFHLLSVVGQHLFHLFPEGGRVVHLLSVGQLVDNDIILHLRG